MSVDYHSREEVWMDIPEDEELINNMKIKKSNQYIYYYVQIFKNKRKVLLTFYGIYDEYSSDVVFAITNQGTTNYTSVPTITITPTPVAAGVGMRATCTLTAGKVTSIIFLSKGYGYSRATPLALAFSGGGGAGAAATATLVHKGYSRRCLVHSPERPASIAPSQVGGEHTDIQPTLLRVVHTRQMDCAAELTRTDGDAGGEADGGHGLTSAPRTDCNLPDKVRCNTTQNST